MSFYLLSSELVPLVEYGLRHIKAPNFQFIVPYGFSGVSLDSNIFLSFGIKMLKQQHFIKSS